MLDEEIKRHGLSAILRQEIAHEVKRQLQDLTFFEERVSKITNHGLETLVRAADKFNQIIIEQQEGLEARIFHAIADGEFITENQVYDIANEVFNTLLPQIELKLTRR
jgi:hypothetical protein